MISKPLNFDKIGHCPVCGWEGKLRDALVVPCSVIDCPVCYTHIISEEETVIIGLAEYDMMETTRDDL